MPFFLDEPEHLSGRFGARRHEEFVGQAVDRLLMTSLGNDVCGRDQGHGPGRRRGSETSADLTLGVRRKQVAVHVARSAAHGGAGHDILGHGGLEEAVRRVYLGLARSDVVLADDASHTAVVVNVAVGVDHGLHRFLAAVLVVEIHADFGSFFGDERIDHGDPFTALNDGHVGQVQVADLIDAVRNLEEAADVDELGLPPKTRIDGVRRGCPFGDEGILLRIPDRVAALPLDHFRRQGSDQSSLRVVEIRSIREW